MVSPYIGKFKVTSGFNLPQRPDHCGLDLVGIDNKNIHSTVNGVVGFAGWENVSNKKQGFGQYVRIIDSATGYHFYFGHLAQIRVSVGQKVTIGTLIGVEGSTGKSTGSHLHYEARQKAGAIYRGTANIAAISGIPNAIGTYPGTKPAPVPATVWKVGSTDKAGVKNVQTALVKCGFPVTVDGIFGKGTETAVKAFQLIHGLTSDGIVGEKTWVALQNASTCPYKEPTAMLKQGDKGEGVKWVQFNLNRKGYNLAVDGGFGVKTANAVASFQKSTGLKADGIVGPKTREKLRG